MFFKKRTGSDSRSPFLYDGEVFHDSVRRERMRADRTEQPLAVVTIELPGPERTKPNYQILADMLNERVRQTDLVGRTLDGRIGILCPDTHSAGAIKLTQDLKEILGQGDLSINFKVYVHSETPYSAEDFEDCGLDVFDLAAWLAQPVPGWKRIVDVVGASMLLLTLSPLLLLVAIAVKATSPGPVLFTQERSGLGGSSFQMLKFRSMQKDAEEVKYELMDLNEQDGPAFKMEDDPRITRVGKVIRKTSIDELPQLWNVLSGKMSLVGPRPLPTDETRRCKAWHRRRVEVTPGLTCIWQVNGRPRESFDEWARMDIQYIQNRTLAHDLKLIAWTVPAVVFCKGA